MCIHKDQSPFFSYHYLPLIISDVPWPAGGPLCGQHQLGAGQMCPALAGVDHPADRVGSAVLHIPLQHDAHHAGHPAGPLPVQVNTFPSLLPELQAWIRCALFGVPSFVKLVIVLMCL